MPRVQIYILCRDRAAYLDEALQSILSQDCSDFEVIISDNSEYDDVQNLIQRKYLQTKYIRRQPTLPALAHFNKILRASRSEFIVLFHDDDVMMPGYVRYMTAALDQHPAVSAVGCNALILRDATLTNKRFMRTCSQQLLLENPESFLPHYMGMVVTGPAPFPGYMYRTSAITGLYLDGSEGGKYSDVTFLLKVLNRGPILWIPEAYMQYRWHSGNDSKTEVIGQRLRLLRYIYRNTKINKSSSLTEEFRFEHWRRWLCLSVWHLKSIRTRKFKIAAKFVFTKALKLSLTRLNFWYRLFYRSM